MDEMRLLESNNFSSPGRNFTVLQNYFDEERPSFESDAFTCSVWGYEEADDHGYSFKIGIEFKESAQEGWDIKKRYSEFKQLDLDVR